MGTIAEKLSYLADTKDLFKDRLNSLGAEIIESTTFRNYLNWLDTFYREVSDKTDLAKNGIVGRTSQSGTPTPDSPQPINNLTGNVSYTVSGTNIETRTFTIPLGDIELCNISDYKDRIYSQNGRFYLEKKTGKVVFDGSENWTINTSYTYNVFYRTLDNYARISNTQTTYCEYYKGIKNTAGIVDFGNNYNNSIGVRTANDNIKDIYISNNSITSASDFKTWLSTHNIVVYYVLATPTTTEITSENYPTLYSQLLAIQEFLTKYKINKEFLLDYSSPEIEY